MLDRRRFMVAASAMIAAPAILPRVSRAQSKSIKIGTVLAGTTISGFLIPDRLKAQGYDAEVLVFPNITQRMQAVASGDVQIGFGGISAAISLAGRGVPISLIANACDGGWALVARGDDVSSVEDLKGKIVAVQPGSAQHLCIQWKLKDAGVLDDLELVFMNSGDMPAAMERGEIAACMPIEPYAAFIEMNGWGKTIWGGYDTPMQKCNLALMAAPDFVSSNPEATKAVLNTHKAITAELQADSSAAADTIVKTLNLPREIAAKSLANTFFSTDGGPAFREAVKALGNMMVEAKMTEKLPDWDAFIKTQA